MKGYHLNHKSIVKFAMLILLLFIIVNISTFSTGALEISSGKVLLDTDPQGGYEGDYVLIYHSSEDSNAQESTGKLSDIDTVQPKGRSGGDISDGKIQYHPEVVTLDDGFDSNMFQVETKDYQKGDTKTFLITPPRGNSNQFKEMDFTVKSVGEYCYVWSVSNEDTEHPVTQEMSDSVQKTYDETIYEDMINGFGEPLDADGTGKVSILLYDIQCGNSPSSYIGGFFSLADIYPNVNGTQMIHIDTYPSIYSPQGIGRISKCYSTLVHELQHLINYSKYVRRVESGDTNTQPMGSWLNEGLSMAAEEMIFPGSSIPSRLTYYNQDYYGKIKEGHSLLYFANSLESYSLSSLFAAYIKDQTEDSRVFSRISDNFAGDDGEAIVKALEGTGLEGIDFSDLTAAYRIALAMNSESGFYGFNGDKRLKGIKPQIYNKNGTSVSLRGGGAILVKPLNGTFIPDSNAGENIRFVGIKSVADGIRITSKPASDSMSVGEKFQLIASVTGEGDIAWVSSHPDVAEVNKDSGELLALKEGTTKITAKVGSYTDEFTLTVKSQSIAITNKKSELVVGQEMVLQAKVNPTTTSAITWSSSDETVATIDKNSGKLKAIALGVTTITATMDNLNDDFRLTVTDTQPSEFEGLEISDKVINVISSSGMVSLAKIVNKPNDAEVVSAGMGDGLMGWTVNLKTNVELDEWIPIGYNDSYPFRGTFNGKDHQIVVYDSAEGLTYAGIFGMNMGTINDANVTIGGTVEGTHYIGGVAGRNQGEIHGSTVTITQKGKLNGIVERATSTPANIGGVAGLNEVLVEDSFVTNNGVIDTKGPAGGGVVGRNIGYKDYSTATIKDATVYNNGLIRSADDTGGILGLNHNQKTGRQSQITGKLDVIISQNGQITSDNSQTSSVGGAIGYLFSPNGMRSAAVTVRIDGKISMPKGEGCSGGFVGEGAPGGNIDVSVTLGPKGAIDKNKNGEFALFIGDSTVYFTHDDILQTSNWVCAVPYGCDFPAFPKVDGNEYGGITDIFSEKTRRIEYPVEGMPLNHINVAKDTPTTVVNITNNPRSNMDGIFIPYTDDPLRGLKSKQIESLKATSVEDTDVMELLDGQNVKAKYKTAANYFDFNLIADGLKITVPAYLEVNGAPMPEMLLDITGNGLVDTEEAAINNKVADNVLVDIKTNYGRIISWSLTKDGVDYIPQLRISPNSDTNKGFTLMEHGLYKITATAKALDGSMELSKTKFVVTGGDGIQIMGKHLTVDDTDAWTNLLDSDETNNQEKPASDQQREEVNIVALNTRIKSYSVSKENIPYEVDLKNDQSDRKTFDLLETGRYKLSALGDGSNEKATKYVNIDVDVPDPPTVKNISGSAIKANTEYEVVLPEENFIQSPIHLEYSVDDGAFVPLKKLSVSASSSNKKIQIKTVDAAKNESEVILLTVESEKATSGGGGRSSSKRKVKEELVVNEEVVEKGYIYGYTDYTFRPYNSVTREELAAMLDRLLIIEESSSYICPFEDIDDSFANTEIAKAFNAKVILGYEDNTFRPKNNVTRAESVALLNRIFLDENARRKENIFTDINNNMWFYVDVVKAIIE